MAFFGGYINHSIGVFFCSIVDTWVRSWAASDKIIVTARYI